MWVKLDDGFPEHPKILQAGPEAGWLFVCGLCYCARFLTDGSIPRRMIPRLSPFRSPSRLAARLIEVGLWEDAGPDAVRVHNYTRRNPTKEQAEKRRARGRERLERWRETHLGNAVTNASTNRVGNAECNAVTNPCPVPVPVPVPVTDRESTPNTGNASVPPVRLELALIDPGASEPFGPAALLALWNAEAPAECPRARVLSPPRAKHARARLGEHPDPGFWKEAIGAMHGSDFLRGKGPRGWVADLDWFLKPESALRLVEGTYRNGKGRDVRRGAVRAEDAKPDAFDRIGDVEDF